MNANIRFFLYMNQKYHKKVCRRSKPFYGVSVFLQEISQDVYRITACNMSIL